MTMNLPHFPIMLTDIVGSLLVIVFSYLMAKNFLKLFKRAPQDALWVYLFWFSSALFIFGLSRSMGHIVKHILYFLGDEEYWWKIAPYSGAVNSMAMVAMAAITMFFRKVLVIIRELEHHQHKLAATSKELVRLNEQMNRLVGERTRSEMALRLAHEVRNPTTIIGGLLRRLSKKNNIDQAKLRVSYLPKMLEQTRKLEEIVARFEDVLSHQITSLVLLDLNSIAKNCVESLLPSARKKGVNLHFTGVDAPLFFKGNKEILELSVRHLIENAIEVCKKGDSVLVSAQPAPDGVALFVEDTGPGISGERLEHILDPRYDDGGSQKIGFGLPFVKQIVEEHGGTLSIDSQEGRGTVVKIEFPTYLPET